MSDAAPSSASPPDDEAAGRRFELVSGLTLAVLAAVLAVVDLGGGKYGDDEIIGTAEKANLYQWYQAKSIKQAVAEQQASLLTALLDAGAVAPEGQEAVRKQVATAQADVERYSVEKKEILEGSAAVGPAGQVLEVDGEKGKVVGTKVWESTLATLGAAGDQFDLSTLWLQLSLVLGAVSLVLQADKLKWSFYASMVLCGVAGTVYGVIAFQIAGAVG